MVQQTRADSDHTSPGVELASSLLDSLAPYVSMYDTTLRDGAQMVGISLTVGDKLKIARLLTELGADYIEGGWPGSNPKDAEFFLRFQEAMAGAPCNARYGTQKTKLAAFGATRRKYSSCEQDANVKALVDSGADVITLVAKAWDVQVTKVLEASLEENLLMIRETVEYFKALGKEVMLDAEHFFDGYKANSQYALAALRTAAEAGADVVVLCDTNGGSMPWQVEDWTRAAKEVLQDWPHVRIGIHTHNDCDMAVANSLAAVRGGATLIQGCMNGYGERTGNANLVSVIGGLQAKMGYRCIPMESLSRLTEIASEVGEIAGQPMRPSQPFVGSSAFAHKGGIHVAAVRKMPESYNHMDPRSVGNTMRSVVSELSGRGNILDKAEQAGLLLDKDVAGSVLARIKQMENEGCTFENAGASVDMLIMRRDRHYRQPFRVLEFSVISSNRGGARGSDSEDDEVGEASSGHCGDWLDANNSHVNQAIVKLLVGNKVKLSAAEGNGPVDALNKALREPLETEYPQLRQTDLADYRVRLLESDISGRSASDSASTTRVTIDFEDEDGNKWTTVGAHTSIVEASFRALVDGLEFGIINCDDDGCDIN
ncbi:2-isopropylmalate synthase [Klebsormidium nitens]|uniref:(R)-citramalate synthase n=1 Tax=Klebsormidium nitens TaxID=105231 RepID=A0A1Y1HTY9_KLENI|nr:2-isopropylmalate synthase [Klebsormidium nitens]|eukprot:GAQ82094.1 2-isopropylmalate synthase [Klebsormidium nitens]